MSRRAQRNPMPAEERFHLGEHRWSLSWLLRQQKHGWRLEGRREAPYRYEFSYGMADSFSAGLGTVVFRGDNGDSHFVLHGTRTTVSVSDDQLREMGIANQIILKKMIESAGEYLERVQRNPRGAT